MEELREEVGVNESLTINVARTRLKWVEGEAEGRD